MKELVCRPHGDTLKESTIDTYHRRHAQVVMPITMTMMRTSTQPITPAMMMMMMHNISHASVGVAMVVMTVAAIQ